MRTLSFRVTRNTRPKPSTFDTARRYSTFAAAVADMGDGVVWKGNEISAFHERHAALLERKPELLERTL